MKIGMVLRDLHHDEVELARALLRLADKHRADHEFFHLGHDLAAWSRRHVRDLAAIAARFDEQLDPEPADSVPVVDSARRWLSERSGRSAEVELVMVRDLREVYLRASSVLTDWEMIGQAAQAIVDEELLELAEKCQPETKRQATWANSKIKESSTQALVV
ncbi:hypothetical protein [Humibacillus xanthopallidus]|uniref:Uncharacterized protein n=1 Tax=Humibacillus xanthopallidus TaxID=412689 RepID=A0A543HHX6_9MICO|nr:hypothetical protein [Humibacillus xanthopallidus]TQM57914.1 hypothetical protein FBY41_3254 [Humibacillus xanthopallidus]